MFKCILSLVILIMVNPYALAKSDYEDDVTYQNSNNISYINSSVNPDENTRVKDKPNYNHVGDFIGQYYPCYECSTQLNNDLKGYMQR